jgi:tetratricopeptide (TPR) repeat protein
VAVADTPRGGARAPQAEVVIRSLLRNAVLLVALLLLLGGGGAILLGRFSEDARVAPAHRQADQMARRVGLGRDALAGRLPWIAAGAGAALFAVALLLRRKGASVAEGGSVAGAAERAELLPALDRRSARKVERVAHGLAKKGQAHEAAEICFESGLLDPAAQYFIEAGDWVRAAGIRHDQNRFLEAAELHLKAGDHETAGSIYASQGEHKRAAECFHEAGRMTVAGELFEKCGDFRRAGLCFREAGFDRQAAKAFIRCQSWKEAADALETVILEERTKTGTGQNPQSQRELQTLVLQAGKLYDQAGELERAEIVLEKGGCHVAAAEVALRRGRFAKAAELFLEGNQPVRAAEVLQQNGEEQEAARILGEYHRSCGADQEAAHYLEQAGEFLEAGDVHRKLQDFVRAGQAYERAGDRAQAAEMYRLGGHPARAAANFEKIGRHEEAAECWKEAGDARRCAVALAQAGRLLQAGEIYRAEGLDDEAIKVLQQVPAGSAEFSSASALLGTMFQGRGQLGLAIMKLKQAIGDGPVDRNGLRLHYTLATVHEANGELREAIAVYEKILACDYHFEDVEQRLASARGRVSPTSRQDAAGAATVVSEEMPAAGRTQPSRYQIVGELGRGGMGIVYKAKDTVLDRIVAYKVLPDALKENPQALKNFLREAKSAAQLNHPNIVTVYDAGEQDGRYYIAMEFVDGNTLKEIVRRRGAIASGGVLHVLVQMCEALAYAHDKKIVHRDIKTANTMWTRDRKAKIMDFGLAKIVEEVRNHTTLVSGTPYYMSPEQTLGRNVDYRTDIYSLGVTIFELATGRLPFTEGNIPYHHVHTPPPDAREIKPDVPALLAEIVARCLRKDPAERFESVREILAQVRAAMAQARTASA